MATATTSWASLRNTAALTVEGLTPSTMASERYRMTRNEIGDFRTYAETSDVSVFREFEIEYVETRIVGPEDHQVQLRETDCQFLMAYPVHGNLYQTATIQSPSLRVGDRGALLAMVEQDAADIAEAIGRRGGTNYVDGQHAMLDDGWQVEQVDGVTLLVMPMTAIYYHDGS